jgi:hypothetical protein
MSEPENFLSRWARRKQAAAEAEAETAPRLETLRATDAGVGTPQSQSEGANENPAGATKPRADATETAEAHDAVFDLTSLPPLESITAETDIRAFLAPGVPAELARAALRRAWGADPKIRDFVGPADYAWDYHTPGSMPGFGPLEMTDELRQVVARILGAADRSEALAAGEPASAATVAYKNTNESNASEAPVEASQQISAGSGQDSAEKEISEARACDELTPCEKEPAAVQHEAKQPVTFDSTARRSHGGALPQ